MRAATSQGANVLLELAGETSDEETRQFLAEFRGVFRAFNRTLREAAFTPELQDFYTLAFGSVGQDLARILERHSDRDGAGLTAQLGAAEARKIGDQITSVNSACKDFASDPVVKDQLIELYDLQVGYGVLLQAIYDYLRR